MRFEGYHETSYLTGCLMNCVNGHDAGRYKDGRCKECSRLINANRHLSSHREPTPRQIARDLGKPTYSTGNPCRKGHICARYVACGNCLECVSERNVELAARRKVARQSQRLAQLSKLREQT